MSDAQDATQNSSGPDTAVRDNGAASARSASVFWVGHSLVEAKTSSEWGEIDLMRMVGILAKSRGLGYSMGNHTLWGTPLSGNWRGRPHTYDRDASAMVAKREAFEKDAARYDVLVATEGVPVAKAIAGGEFSSYYLRRFYCALKSANPRARVFLYQSWINLQGGTSSSGIRSRNDWRSAMAQERAAWVELARSASRPDVRAPSTNRWLDRLGWNARTDGGCRSEDPILIVPVGDAFVRLADRIADPRPGDVLRKSDGTAFLVEDLFANPYVEPAPASPSQREAKADRRLRDPSKAHDDIHPSLDGIYMAALVHFATIYRQSPVGLPFPAIMGEGLARTLQCIAWETVTAEPLAGVGAAGGC